MLFDALVWRDGRAKIGELELRRELPEQDTRANEADDQALVFYKYDRHTDSYNSAFAKRPDFAPRRVLELGIWGGGSTAVWAELLRPAKLVAVDIEDRVDPPSLRRWIDARGFEKTVKTYWRTNQADTAALRRILDAEFDGPLDLVIDDASHKYGPTRTSFEFLFPRVRPGGLYVIEDWAWGHASHIDVRILGTPTLTRLVTEIVEAAGSERLDRPKAIASIETYRELVVIERGPADIPEVGFLLDERIRRQVVDRPDGVRRALSRLRRYVGRLQHLAGR